MNVWSVARYNPNEKSLPVKVNGSVKWMRRILEKGLPTLPHGSGIWRIAPWVTSPTHARQVSKQLASSCGWLVRNLPETCIYESNRNAVRQIVKVCSFF